MSDERSGQGWGSRQEPARPGQQASPAQQPSPGQQASPGQAPPGQPPQPTTNWPTPPDPAQAWPQPAQQPGGWPGQEQGQPYPQQGQQYAQQGQQYAQQGQQYAQQGQQYPGQEQPYAGAASVPPGNLLRLPFLVVQQRAKLVELTNEYAVLDENGNQVGAVRQVGQSGAQKAVRLLTSFGPLMTQRLEIVDAWGNLVLTVTKPRAWVKPRVVVAWPNGVEIGHIALQLRLGKARFTLLDPGGREIGRMHAENFRAWDFKIEDEQGREVGRVTKKWAGVAKEFFTHADNYIVQVDPALPDPLRTIAVASALAIDTVLKQTG